MHPETPLLTARIAFLGVSGGGVPKQRIDRVQVSKTGLIGDRHRNLRLHGGPERAVCLYSIEVIERLRTEGHPIEPGAAGENVTLEGGGQDASWWSRLEPGTRLTFDGAVELEIASYCTPCKTIRACFDGGDVSRIDQARHPGASRLYARVLVEGSLSVGERVRISGPFR